MYHYDIEKKQPATKLIYRWCLDFPRADEAADAVALQQQGMLLQGWVLLTKKGLKQREGAQIFVRTGGVTEYFPLDRERPDVVSAVLQKAPQGHPQLRCGFRFHLVLNNAYFEVGICLDGEHLVLASGTIKGPFEILRGRENWLFLDNDTNQSVSQHIGEMGLDSRAKKSWQQYFDSTQQIATQQPFALLVAPAKEAVFADKHPLPRAERTVIDEMLALTPPEYPIVYPANEMSQLAQRSFRVTDTHWSVHGARLATELLVNQLGLDVGLVQAKFAKDTYKSRLVGGDLGKKVYPPLKAEEDVLANRNYRRKLVYDNGLGNFGRVLIMKHAKAAFDARLVLFGSSSAYSMLNYLYRCFSEVILIHSAGNIDEQVLAALQPDYVAAQTNGRFVVRAPIVGYDLGEVMGEKLRLLAPGERAELEHKAKAMLLKHQQSDATTDSVEYLHQLFMAQVEQIGESQ